ncbi:hypothetical protein BZG36_04305 [Bifiguratus adelaidae]|uniref:F-box domain-containing protein n=1 Tax=Bifiguratus adelaidae TaxID=1938954 RepID=A0A261XZR9_9FUNG|nr:hypothetical protein BZG36_04305 [Bifiguratus adelaidae]
MATTLPPELLSIVFELCSGASLSSCARVSKTWNLLATRILYHTPTAYTQRSLLLLARLAPHNATLIKRLDFSACKDSRHLTGHALNHLLTNAPYVQHLNLKQTSVKNVKTILRQCQLVSCALGSVTSGALLRSLGEQRRLRFLDVSKSNISDEDERMLGRLPSQLWYLDVSSTEVTDRMLMYLPPHLQGIGLENCANIGDRGVSELARLPLRQLNARGIRLTDRGLDKLSSALEQVDG